MAGRIKGSPKVGGRKKGSLNKRTVGVIAKMEALECDPIAGMALIALNKKNPPELRGRMFSELAQYLYPKRKSIEHSGEVATQNVLYAPTVAENAEAWQKQFLPIIN